MSKTWLLHISCYFEHVPSAKSTQTWQVEILFKYMSRIRKDFILRIDHFYNYKCSYSLDFVIFSNFTKLCFSMTKEAQAFPTDANANAYLKRRVDRLVV